MSIYIILWCAPVVTGASCIGFFLSSLVGIIGSPFIMLRDLSIGIIQLGLGIAFIGASILLGIVTINLSRKLVVITRKFNFILISLLKKKVVS